MLEKGRLVPDGDVTAHDGKHHRLWDFRQKSHLLLVCDPDASEDTLRHHVVAAERHRKVWDWLEVKVLVSGDAPAMFGPGVYAIDRYGGFLNLFPLAENAWDRLQNEFLYYEARHC